MTETGRVDVAVTWATWHEAGLKEKLEPTLTLPPTPMTGNSCLVLRELTQEQLATVLETGPAWQAARDWILVNDLDTGLPAVAKLAEAK